MAATHEDDEHRAKTKEKAALKAAQIELVKLQRHVIETDQKILVVLEGATPPARTARSNGSSGTYRRAKPALLLWESLQIAN